VCVCVHVYIHVYAWAAVRGHLGAPELNELLEPRSVQREFRASKQLPNRYVNSCVCVYRYVCVCVCVCVCIHTYIRIYTHTYT
jgi:hypothetical protein